MSHLIPAASHKSRCLPTLNARELGAYQHAHEYRLSNSRERSAKPSKVALSACLRKLAGGRKRLTESDPGLLKGLQALVEPASRGDPMSPLRRTCKSTSHL